VNGEFCGDLVFYPAKRRTDIYFLLAGIKCGVQSSHDAELKTGLVAYYQRHRPDFFAYSFQWHCLITVIMRKTQITWRVLGAGVALLTAAAVTACAGSGSVATRRPARAQASRPARPRPAGEVLSRGTTAIGVAVDRATGGYWILKSNGGVANFHAPWHGSVQGKVVAGSVATAIAAGKPGGYLILTSAGAVYAFGTPSYGSDAGQLPPGVTAVGLTGDPATGGYWILRSDGVVSSFHAPRRGDAASPEPSGSALLAITAGRSGGYLTMESRGALPDGYGGRFWSYIPTSRKVAALTFDIGAANLGGLPKVLRTLRRDHAAATFFLIGAWVNRFKAAARAIVKSGAAIGDLSLTHPHFPRISDASMRDQVLSAQSEISKVTGAQPWPWFRFPFGDHNQHTITVVNSLGFATIGWTVDTLGWEGTSRGITVASIVARVVAARRPGEIVLMHPAATTDGSTLDAQALPYIISALRGYGYSFVTINALRPAIGFRVPSAVVSVRGYGTPSFGSDAGQLPRGVTAVAIAGDPATGGYWIAQSNGAITAFHAPRRGSLTGLVPPGYCVTAIAAGLHGGYLVLTSNGGIHTFGTPWYGSIVDPVATG
jgi:peptidoglycan/xylan/chitin deacetylase (PgdA/CDA1 family)